MRRASGIVVLAAAFAGCSLLTTIDGVSGGGDDGRGEADATATDTGGGTNADTGLDPNDTGVPADSNADVDAALPNLQPNGGFELVNGSGCGNEWGVFQGSGTRVGDARSGSYACKACGTSTSESEYTLANGDSAKLEVAPGQRIRVEAWVRVYDDAASQQSVRGVIRIFAPDGGTNVVQRIDPPLVPVTTTWMRLETILDVTVAGRFNYYVAFLGGALASCALVDDVVVQRMW
jgi:hypothetical protein